MVLRGDESPDDYYVNIIGGAALLWEDASLKGTTGDIDVYSYYVPLEASQMFHLYLMNTRSASYPYALPYNYEDRLENIIETSYCCINRVSWEDILFAKFQRNDKRDQDDADIIVCRSDFDWESLQYLLTDKDEACGSGITRGSYQELLMAYNNCAGRWNEYEFSQQEIFALMNNAL